MKTKVEQPAHSIRQSALDRTTAMRLAATEYDRAVAQLRSLEAADWSRQTSCTAWDVRALACHMLGMAEMSASLVEQLRQLRKAKKSGGTLVHALTDLQVAERREMRPSQIVERFEQVAPRAVQGRRRTPAIVRRRCMPDDQPVGGSRTARSSPGASASS